MLSKHARTHTLFFAILTLAEHHPDAVGVHQPECDEFRIFEQPYKQRVPLYSPAEATAATSTSTETASTAAETTAPAACNG
jgi:hypothetical protein